MCVYVKINLTARPNKLLMLKLLMQLWWASQLQQLPSGPYTVTCIQDSDPPKLFYFGPLGFSAEAAGLSASLRASLQQWRAGFIQSRHLRVSPSVISRIWDCNLWVLWTFLPHNGFCQSSKPPTDAGIAPTSRSLRNSVVTQPVLMD